MLLLKLTRVTTGKFTLIGFSFYVKLVQSKPQKTIMITIKNINTDNNDKNDNGNKDFKSLYYLALPFLHRKSQGSSCFFHQNSSRFLEKLVTFLCYELHFSETEKITFRGKKVRVRMGG